VVAAAASDICVSKHVNNLADLIFEYFTNGTENTVNGQKQPKTKRRRTTTNRPVLSKYEKIQQKMARKYTSVCQSFFSANAHIYFYIKKM
jgi:hypothetical protein